MTISKLVDDAATFATLGEPDVRIAGFSLWLQSTAESTGPYEDWLVITAHCASPRSSVWVSGNFLEVRDLERALSQIAELTSGRAHAVLDSCEPNVKVEIAWRDSIGHLTAKVDLTQDHLLESHSFTFEVDQTELAAIIRSLRVLLARVRARDA
jgi:hypothetical protein